MASATLTVTVTDTANHPLTQVRDKLLIRWNYLSGGDINWNPLNTNPDKLDFIEAKLARYLKTEYKAQLDAEAYAAAQAPDVDIQ